MELEIDPSGIAITDTITNTNNVAIDSSNIDISGTHKIILNDINGISINNLTLQPTNTLGSATNITIDELAHLSGVSSNIQTQFNLLKGDAPAALDTIAELADAIGDDADFLTNLNTNIAAKVAKTGDETISGIKTIQGSLNFDTNGTISGDVIPVNNNLTNIGSASKQINAIHANDVNVAGDIHMNGNIDICGGNFTITNEELSKLDGVNDNIQTQINAAIAGNVWDVNGVKIYYNGGNVGIGTNDPTGKLEVHDGPIIVKPGTNATNALQFHSGSGNTYYTNDIAWYDSTGAKKVMIGSSSNNTTGHFRFWENGSQYFTFINDASNTRVGINRVDPQYNLDVTGDINFTGNLYKNGSLFSTGGGSSVWSESTGNISRSSGYVGIGTTNPLTYLHIKGAHPANTNLSDANDFYMLIGSTEWNTGSYRLIGFGYIDSSTKCPPAYIGYKTANQSENSYGDLIFGTRNGTGDGAPTERMRIMYNGYVGIGDDSPGAYLKVKGTWNNLLAIQGDGGSEKEMRFFSGSGYCAIAVNSSNTEAMTFRHDTNPRVGIGMNNPRFPLEIYSSHSHGFTFANDRTNAWGVTQATFSQYSKVDIYWHTAAWTRGRIIFSSDERIKKDITIINDETALNIINNIETYEYNYKDLEKQEEHKTIGFIAQNVMEHLPNAVSLKEQFIPDELREIKNAVWEDNKLIIDDIDFTDSHTGLCKFYLTDEDISGDGIMKEVKVQDDKKTFIFDKKWKQVYLHSKEINDFHTLDKNQIYALHHSGIQELSRKNDALNIEKETMQTQITTLLEENNSMKSRLEALEAAIINLQNN